ncbi:MAG: GtrA family protein [bacterium]|nr:GtrA family protein [bacterium]
MTQLNANMMDDTGSAKGGLRNPLDAPITGFANRFGEKSKEVERFVKFAIVGVSGAIVDFGILIALQATILPPTRPLNVAIATSIAFVCAVLNNFVWTRWWVYPDSRTHSMRRQLAMFFFISVVGWLGRTLWITLMYYPIGHALMPSALPLIRLLRPEYMPSHSAEEKLGSIVAQLIAMAVVMLWNFFANRHWTYNDVE